MNTHFNNFTKNLCINDSVMKLGSIQAINDRCLEMQKCKSNIKIFYIIEIFSNK